MRVRHKSLRRAVGIEHYAGSMKWRPVKTADSENAADEADGKPPINDIRHCFARLAVVAVARAEM